MNTYHIDMYDNHIRQFSYRFLMYGDIFFSTKLTDVCLWNHEAFTLILFEYSRIEIPYPRSLSLD